MSGSPLPEEPWGALLAAYFILIGISSGVTLVPWLLPSRDGAVAVTLDWWSSWIALFALAIASAVLIVDLGRPERFFLMITEFTNLGSVMSVGAKFIALEGALLVLSVYLLHLRRAAAQAGRSTLSPGTTTWVYRTVASALAVTSLALAVYPVSLLARTWGSPLANTPQAGTLFLATALLMGVASILCVSWLLPEQTRAEVTGRLRALLLALVVAEAVLLLFEGLALYGNGQALEVVLHDITQGSGAPVLWGLIVTTGLVVPALVLLASPRGRASLLVASAAAVAGAATIRYVFFAMG